MGGVCVCVGVDWCGLVDACACVFTSVYTDVFYIG